MKSLSPILRLGLLLLATHTSAAPVSAKPEGFQAALVKQIQSSLGVAYQDGPLGEGPGAKYDSDPLIDPAHVDCVTFVEQSIAFADTQNAVEASALLQKIRYAGGKIDFEARHHFFISDWIAHNTFCHDVTTTLGMPTAKVTRTISRRSFFEKQKAPELGKDTPDKKQTLVYVPVANGAAAEARLPSVALLVFVGKIDWLFALHCGFYVRDANGSGMLYHASSKAGRVIATPLAQYLDENKTRYLGFTAYRVDEPRW